ncbi:MAG: hypothetical protein P8K76_11550 [Candidatus Binatia bacterium]|nr:hypothetical protein [Candidatus Binatia bacterium]
MTSSALILALALVAIVIAVVASWRQLEASRLAGKPRKGLLVLVVFLGSFLGLGTAVILTARGACTLLDCRSYLEEQKTIQDAASRETDLAQP